jgi:photosystem II stability/assembly factor-like uncharacterized protein
MNHHMTRTVPALLLALAMAGAATGAARAGSLDPLDRPAQATPLAERGLYNGLAFAGTRIVAVGSRGHILLSEDGGQHWTQAEVPVRSDLTAVQFPTASDGWAVGHDGVLLASRDGGRHWTRQLDGRAIGPLLVQYYAGLDAAAAGLTAERLEQLRGDARRFADEGPDKPLLGVWFEDAQRGWVVGAFNLLLHTTDGGASWTPWLHRDDNPKSLHLYAIEAVDGTPWIVGEQGLVMQLDRTAQRFRAVVQPYRGTLFGIAGDAARTVVYGLRGNALQSRDGGASWTALNSPLPVSLTAAVGRADGSRLLLGQGGQVLALDAGSAALTPVALDARVPASAALRLDDTTLLIAGPKGLRRVQLTATDEARP